jgi:hypothetical protein
LSLCQLYDQRLHRTIAIDEEAAEKAVNDAELDRKIATLIEATQRQRRIIEFNPALPKGLWIEQSHKKIRPADIRASAERILHTYLLPGTERHLTLPADIAQQVATDIEGLGRYGTEAFNAARDHAFAEMEQDAFPSFLTIKALGNLALVSVFLRLLVGALSLFGGLWAAFVLLFMGYGRRTRIWVRDRTHFPSAMLITAALLANSSLFCCGILFGQLSIPHRRSARNFWIQRKRFHGF